MTTFERVYAAVRLIPRGSVATLFSALAGAERVFEIMRCTSTPSRE